MALRFGGTDPFLRASIGALNGYALRQSPSSVATLLKRNAVSTWQGIYIIDEGNTTNYYYASEFNPSNQLTHAISPADGGRSAAGFNNTTDWMIAGYTWTGGTGSGGFVFRWKIGTGAWQSSSLTVGSTNSATIGSTYRHIIGNEAGLGDDASFDWVCTGSIKSTLAQATFESLDMASIASWDAVFTGANAWLLDGEAIGSRTDRTGNGGNEVSRSAGLTLVADPSGFSWGGGAPKGPPLYLPSRRGVTNLLRR